MIGALLLGVVVAQAAPAPTPFADQRTIDTAIADMRAEMRRSGSGFAYRPLVEDGRSVAAIEVWARPGNPAVHPDAAEYAIVLDGAGTLVSGGTMVEPKASAPGLVEGSRIEGGTTRRLAKGDVMLIPAGVPHWFGVTGDRLVLLGMKLGR
ncbi:cupin domain-containing protein [Sphingomonas sp. Leaf4]|uniref:cupin domain-containing protein n=1 Tax=Sphingomonas sp. Leaf4 TaxID=2876553 RepID=UPI001E43BC65|nr:cupin domain-containing protein [Sphingomonas sp. Leaf4]